MKGAAISFVFVVISTVTLLKTNGNKTKPLPRVAPDLEVQALERKVRNEIASLSYRVDLAKLSAARQQNQIENIKKQSNDSGRDAQYHAGRPQ